MIRVFCEKTYATVRKLPHIDNSHIHCMKTKRMHAVTNIPQPTCMAIFNELINSLKVL